MFRRVSNVKVKELLILSRIPKCCRFKASRAPTHFAAKKYKILSNLRKSNERNQSWIVEHTVNIEDPTSGS